MTPSIVVPLDYPDATSALQFVERVSPALCRLKVGKELFTVAGPALVEQLVERGYDVFLDLKFHDIPHTVSQAVRAAARLGVWMVNVHALGGRAMLTAAREALAGEANSPLLIGVTVLTSMDADQLAELGLPAPTVLVPRLAELVHDCGLDGVVCSAQEAAHLRQRFGAGFRLVTPGIRPAGCGADDQRRIMTPEAAVAAGADDLVIGRPITQAADPVAALESIRASLGAH
jgi:orotidine-5'-phosphate decarboxylase